MAVCYRQTFHEECCTAEQIEMLMKMDQTQEQSKTD